MQIKQACGLITLKNKGFMGHITQLKNEQACMTKTFIIQASCIELPLSSSDYRRNF